jgi:hypothetical protein
MEYPHEGMMFFIHVRWWKAYSQQIRDLTHKDSTQHLSQSHSLDSDPLQNLQTKRNPAWEVCQLFLAKLAEPWKFEWPFDV